MSYHPPEFRNPETHLKKWLPKGEKVAIGIFEAHGLKWIRTASMGDSLGTYAYVGGVGVVNFVMIAREYILTVKGSGTWVGAGEDVLRRAIGEGRYLLIYIEDDHKVYVFNPDECFREGFVSYRYNKTFYDFPLKLGANLVKWLDSMQRGVDSLKQGLDGWIT